MKAGLREEPHQFREVQAGVSICPASDETKARPKRRVDLGQVLCCSKYLPDFTSPLRVWKIRDKQAVFQVRWQRRRGESVPRSMSSAKLALHSDSRSTNLIGSEKLRFHADTNARERLRSKKTQVPVANALDVANLHRHNGLDPFANVPGTGFPRRTRYQSHRMSIDFGE